MQAYAPIHRIVALIALALALTAAGCEKKDTDTDEEKQETRAKGAEDEAADDATAKAEDDASEKQTDEDDGEPGETDKVELPKAPEGGLVVIDSQQSYDDTVKTLEGLIESKGMTLAAKVDHTANAESVKKKLRPTTLFIFGNPNAGTPLMQAAQTAAIDLPMKILVWEDADGKVHLGYNHPTWIAQRHGIEGKAKLVTTMANALKGFANAAAQKPE